MGLVARTETGDVVESATGRAGKKRALRTMSLGQMTELMAEAGEKPYRARQLHGWVYLHGARSFDELRNVPKSLREWLAEHTALSTLELVRTTGKEGGTRKILFRLADGRFIESVLMRDERSGRTGLCVSSQVGCAVGCTFCLTGFGGFQRHCTAEEIVSQVIEIRGEHLAEGERIQNVVFMGMGEPMLNLGPVIESVRIIGDGDGIAISPRRITVSTAGVIPGIEEFGRAETGANLAVSLNATTDETRRKIMPLNKRWPINKLIAACAAFPMKARQRITMEYVLMKGVNDTEADARRLVKLLHPLRCKVNLIMFNRHELLDFEPVDKTTVDMFYEALSNARYTVAVRWSKGADIEAACGQLAAHKFENAS